MTRSVMIVSMMASGLLMLFSFNLNVIMGIPADLVEKKGDYLFGRTIGITEDENGKPLWIISGIWKTNLSNQTQATDNSTVLNIDIEMIKTDGTLKDTHALTNFMLKDISNKQNNITVFDGTITISMPQGPVNEVPLSIRVMNNSLGVISIDPIKTNNHFGTMPIYGIPLEESKS